MIKSHYLEILYRIFLRFTNLLVELGIESYVFNEHVATIREDLTDGLEPHLPKVSIAMAFPAGARIRVPVKSKD